MYFSKYDKLGDYHWREYANKTIYGQHADKVKDWINEKYVLDIGAGDGLITHLLEQKGLKCIGIDDNVTAIKLATERGVSVIFGDAYNLDFEDKLWDAVHMGDVIEHFEFPDKAVIETKRILKDKGILYITTPPSNGKAVQDPFHYREYTKEELKSYIEGFGFKLIEPIETKFVRMYAKFQLL